MIHCDVIVSVFFRHIAFISWNYICETELLQVICKLGSLGAYGRTQNEIIGQWNKWPFLLNLVKDDFLSCIVLKQEWDMGILCRSWSTWQWMKSEYKFVFDMHIQTLLQRTKIGTRKLVCMSFRTKRSFVCGNSSLVVGGYMTTGRKFVLLEVYTTRIHMTSLSVLEPKERSNFEKVNYFLKLGVILEFVVGEMKAIKRYMLFFLFCLSAAQASNFFIVLNGNMNLSVQDWKSKLCSSFLKLLNILWGNSELKRWCIKLYKLKTDIISVRKIVYLCLIKTDSLLNIGYMLCIVEPNHVT